MGDTFSYESPKQKRRGPYWKIWLAIRIHLIASYMSSIALAVYAVHRMVSENRFPNGREIVIYGMMIAIHPVLIFFLMYFALPIQSSKPVPLVSSVIYLVVLAVLIYRARSRP